RRHDPPSEAAWSPQGQRRVHVGDARGQSAPLARFACGARHHGVEWIDGRGASALRIRDEIAANRMQTDENQLRIPLFASDFFLRLSLQRSPAVNSVAISTNC